MGGDARNASLFAEVGTPHGERVGAGAVASGKAARLARRALVDYLRRPVVRLYALSNMIPPEVRGTSYRATWAYHELFHGQASGVVNRFGERPYRPLPLVRNRNLVPPVFMPGAALVVDGAIAQRLAAFEHVDVAPCVWESVYDDPVDASAVEDVVGRFSWLTEDYGDYVRGRLRPPRGGERLPERFQIVAPFLDAVRAPFACDASIDVPSPFEDLPPVATSAALHARYPVVRVETHFVFRADAFRIIEAHVGDAAVFSVLTFDVPD